MLASKATGLITIREKQDKDTLIKENIDHKDIFNVKTDDNHNKNMYHLKMIAKHDHQSQEITSIYKKTYHTVMMR